LENMQNEQQSSQAWSGPQGPQGQQPPYGPPWGFQGWGPWGGLSGRQSKETGKPPEGQERGEGQTPGDGFPYEASQGFHGPNGPWAFYGWNPFYGGCNPMMNYGQTCFGQPFGGFQNSWNYGNYPQGFQSNWNPQFYGQYPYYPYYYGFQFPHQWNYGQYGTYPYTWNFQYNYQYPYNYQFGTFPRFQGYGFPYFHNFTPYRYGWPYGFGQGYGFPWSYHRGTTPWQGEYTQNPTSEFSAAA
jgi:hypothetical protein